MTKKHYEAIAKILSHGKDQLTDKAKLTKKLADYFATDNPKFNRDKFIEACKQS